MDAGAAVLIAFGLGLLLAFVVARRKGKAAWTAAVAEARAEGRAEAESAAAASAVATGGRVHLHLGAGDSSSSYYDPTDPDRDGLPASVIRAELRRMDALQRSRVLESLRVGELLDGVQHRSDAVEPDHRAVAAGGVRNGDVPAVGPAPVKDFNVASDFGFECWGDD